MTLAHVALVAQAVLVHGTTIALAQAKIVRAGIVQATVHLAQAGQTVVQVHRAVQIGNLCLY